MLKSVSSAVNAIGALNYVGTWNASTNTPTLVSGTGTKGDYYVVSVAGSTSLNGISNWGVGDWVVFNGSAWQRVEGGADLNGVNLSVSGTTTLSGLTASTALALDASKNVVSVTNTGSGANVLATSPSLTTPSLGAATATSIRVNGASAIAGTPVEVAGNVAGYNRTQSVTTVGQIGQAYTTACPNGQTFTFNTASAKLITISTGGGNGALIFADYTAATIVILADPTSAFQASSTPGAGKTGIFKSANNHTISIKNNTGSTVNYNILSVGPVVATTDPA